jgi:hypothetical protein
VARSTTSCQRVEGTGTRRLASRRMRTAIRTRVSSLSGSSSLTGSSLMLSSSASAMACHRVGLQ